MAEGLYYGAYSFTAYKSEVKTPAPMETTIVLGAKEAAALKAALPRVAVVMESVRTARDLINTPGCDLVPEVYAEKVRELFKGTGVKVKVRRADDLAQEGFNGLLTVGRGSKNPPCMVTLSWSPASPATDKRLGLEHEPRIRLLLRRRRPSQGQLAESLLFDMAWRGGCLGRLFCKQCGRYVSPF